MSFSNLEMATVQWKQNNTKWISKEAGPSENWTTSLKQTGKAPFPLHHTLSTSEIRLTLLEWVYGGDLGAVDRIWSQQVVHNQFTEVLYISHGHHKYITRTSHEHHMNITRTSHEHHMDITWTSHEHHNHTRTSHGHHMDIT